MRNQKASKLTLLGAFAFAVLLAQGLPGLAADEGGAGDAPAASGDETASGGDVEAEKKVEPESEWKPPWRGSSVTYGHGTAAVGLDKGAEQTWNPVYYHSLTLSPRWWTGEKGFIKAGISFDQELTDNDYTKYEREVTFGDISLGAGMTSIYTIPVVEIGIAPSLTAVFPTSKASQAKTLVIATKGSLGLSKSFKEVLKGASISYTFGLTKYFYRFQTGEVEEDPYADSDNYDTDSIAANTDSSVSNDGIYGVKPGSIWQGMSGLSPDWRFSNNLSLGLQFVDWLGMNLGFGLSHQIIPDVNNDDINDLYSGAEDVEIVGFEDGHERVRYSVMYNGELTATPMPALSVGFGFNTMNPTVSPDGTYYEPFFNRNTVVYLDLRISIDGLVSQLTTSEE